MTTAVADARAAKIRKSLAAGEARADLLRNGPIPSTLARLSLPNLVALSSAAIVSIAETAYVGSLGIASLGGIALAFPIFMLMQMLSAGVMGGTISGAISRALGAGDYQRAQSLAPCAVVIGLVLGLALSVTVRIGGPAAYALLGGSGEVLREEIAYSNVAALAIVFIWITNMFASIARGSGIMTVPAWTILLAGVGQVLVGGTLGLGLGPAPRLGMAGVAIGQLVAFTGAAFVLLAYLRFHQRPSSFAIWTRAFERGKLCRDPQGWRHRYALAVALGCNSADIDCDGGSFRSRSSGRIRQRG